MDVAWLTISFFSGLVIMLLLGLPIAFSIGSIAMLFCLFLWGPEALYQIASAAWGTGNDWLFVCIPLFIYMGTILQESGIAEDLYEMMYRWMGRVRGGLAIGTIIVCTVFAAMAGVSGAACVTMGVVALPAMLSRNYDKGIALGSIAAGGALGILIPPSLMMILYGSMTGVSIGKLFAGGILPGIMLAIIFIAYIVLKSLINPKIGPPLPINERVSFKEKIISLKAVFLPLLIILLVLGGIYLGMATPTEAAGFGAFGALLSTIIHRRLTWKAFERATIQAFRLNGMVMWIVIGATCYRSVYAAMGGQEFIQELLTSIPMGNYAILIGIQFIIFLMGMFLDPAGLVMIATPIFVPVIQAAGIDLLWFGILFVMNLEMSYLTPPLGMNLFYLRGVAPADVTMGDIYKSVVPFVVLQAIGLVVIIMFPVLATWLPSLLRHF